MWRFGVAKYWSGTAVYSLGGAPFLGRNERTHERNGIYGWLFGSFGLNGPVLMA